VAPVSTRERPTWSALVAAASALAAFAGAALPGCGYKLVRPCAPFGASPVAVVPFLEDEPVGIAPDLAQALAELLAASGATLTNDRHAADAVLTGRVLTITTAPVANPSATIQMYRVTVTLLATLTRGKTELWRSQLTVSDDFLPATPAPLAPTTELATEANRREALRRLARAAAQSLADQLRLASATAPAPAPPPAAKSSPAAKHTAASSTVQPPAATTSPSLSSAAPNGPASSALSSSAAQVFTAPSATPAAPPSATPSPAAPPAVSPSPADAPSQVSP
jgi:hypothetical protein